MDIKLKMPRKMFELFFRYYYSWDTFYHVFKENTNEDAELRQLILDTVKKNRMYPGISYSDETNRYTIPGKINQQMNSSIEKVRQRYIGETLAFMLAARDYFDKFGRYPANNEQDRDEKEFQEMKNLENKYKVELATHGVFRLRLSM